MNQSSAAPAAWRQLASSARQEMSYFIGIDIGSRTCKAVLADSSGAIVKRELMSSGTDYALAARTLRDRLSVGLSLAAGEPRVVTTGHNVRLSWADEHATDIQCCARGVHFVSPSARTIVDIQAQTSQVIRLGENGLVTSFVVSEKCAAGSGRFLEVVANVLRVKLEDIGPMSLKSKQPVSFSTGCAVFGESEAISRVAEGVAKEDILAGVHRSIADKIGALVARAGLEEPCVIVGGGALDLGLVKSIEDRLSIKPILPPHPEFIGAIGAAVIARERNPGSLVSAN